MNPTAHPIDIRELVCHRHPMLLIDGLVNYGEDFVETFVTHQSPSLFADHEGKVPAWVGIEYMAQTLSVYVGLERRTLGLPPKIGFLMGTRKYAASVPAFIQGERVEILATRQYMSEEDKIALFHCTIRARGNTLAEADIKAIQPDSPEELFAL